MKRILATLALLLAPLGARAQTAQPWDTNVLAWDPPTRCSDGPDLTHCVIVGYRIERTPVPGGSASTVVGTVGPNILTFTHTGAPAGTNCYKVYALSSAGASAQPSNELCKTNTAPPPTQVPPGPVQNLRAVATIAYSILPDYQHFAFVRGPRYGAVSLGAACDASRSTGDGYFVVARRSQVTPRPPDGVYVVARCAT